jgi:hypothetical protein
MTFARFWHQNRPDRARASDVGEAMMREEDRLAALKVTGSERRCFGRPTDERSESREVGVAPAILSRSQRDTRATCRWGSDRYAAWRWRGHAASTPPDVYVTFQLGFPGERPGFDLDADLVEAPHDRADGPRARRPREHAAWAIEPRRSWPQSRQSGRRTGEGGDLGGGAAQKRPEWNHRTGGGWAAWSARSTLAEVALGLLQCVSGRPSG